MLTLLNAIANIPAIARTLILRCCCGLKDAKNKAATGLEPMIEVLQTDPLGIEQ